MAIRQDTGHDVVRETIFFREVAELARRRIEAIQPSPMRADPEDPFFALSNGENGVVAQAGRVRRTVEEGFEVIRRRIILVEPPRPRPDPKDSRMVFEQGPDPVPAD